MEECRQTGVYASCVYDEKSLKNLEKWLNDQCDLIPDPVPMEKIHTTIVYSRKDFPCPVGEEIQLRNPIDFYPSGFALLGNPEDELACLVMVLDAEPLELVHEMLIQEGAQHDYDDYIPHITLSYSVPKNFDYSTIEIPKIDLKPNKIKFEPLDLNWRLQEA